MAAAIAPHQAPPLRDQVTRIASAAGLAPGSQPHAAAVSPGDELRLAPSPASFEAAPTLSGPVDSESVRAHELDLTHPVRGLPPRDDVEPLTANLCRLHVTVSRHFLQKLEAGGKPFNPPFESDNVEYGESGLLVQTPFLRLPDVATRPGRSARVSARA